MTMTKQMMVDRLNTRTKMEPTKIILIDATGQKWNIGAFEDVRKHFRSSKETFRAVMYTQKLLTKGQIDIKTAFPGAVKC